ncbi:hypothetical protein RUND412_007903 [Rhizina undulata]
MWFSRNSVAFGVSIILSLFLSGSVAWLLGGETDEDIIVSSDRLNFTISKLNGDLYNVLFDGIDTLGQYSSTTGRGCKYLICYCVETDVKTSAGEYTVGSNSTTNYTLIDDYDSTNTHFVGIYLVDSLPTGQTFHYWFFIRDDGSNAIHQWTRLTYVNETVPYLTTLGEYRYLFRPQQNTIWTHLSVNENTEAPIPTAEDFASEVKVQDATWVFPNSTSAYSKAVGEYFTKYVFADNFDYTHKAHGIYADGSKTNGSTYGVWQLVNTRDTYYGGPHRFDLQLDGAVYNKWSTSHYGSRYANITNGFDRTFGPQALYFNGGNNQSLAELRENAYLISNEDWNKDFYDFVGKKYVDTYVRSEQRGKLVGQINIPNGTWKSQAVLAQNGVDYSDNVGDPTAHQHWTNVDLETGEFEIDRVAEGIYRLTITFFGVFGDFYEDDVVVAAGSTTNKSGLQHAQESHGTELWRIGTPDRTAGEFKHGYELDEEHTSHFAQYRQVWQAYDFPTEFPNGVDFTIGESTELADWNYIHWSAYGPTYDHPTIVGGVNNFTIRFNLTDAPSASDNFTFTIALAGAHGSLVPLSFDDNNILIDWTLAPVELYTYVNDYPEPFLWWIWEGYSSSLGVRSGISGYNLKTYLTWSGALLNKGENRIVLNLKEDSNSYVQYDALRLEKS